MIKVIRMNIEDILHFQLRRLSFPLKVSRNVWLSDDKLILEYPLQFDKLCNIGEAVAFSLLPIAFCEASNIELPPELSIEKGTQERIDKICALWNKWFLCNRKVKVLANIVKPQISNGNKRYGAQLFSGGVDSTATFKRQREKIRYLVLYKGADVPVTQPERFEEIKRYTGEFAKEHNKDLIVLSTNVHYLGAASWEYMAHCCAMVGPLLALSNYINTIYISATHAGRKPPLGSHPDLDPLVSTENLQTVHDGFELNRPDKIALLATEPILLKRLRACGNMAYFAKNTEVIDGRYNCGRCEKCYRTTMILSLLEVSPEYVPFPKQALSLHNITSFLENANLRKGLKLYWSENLKFFESSSRNIEGKQRLIFVARKILGSLYEDYKQDFPRGYVSEYISIWRKLEKALGLEFDSLQRLKKLFRSFKGRPYRKFIKKYEGLTKIS